MSDDLSEIKGSPQKRRFCGGAKAELYREQARKLRIENDAAEAANES
nr:MAG TPA: hypothetical protein [Caudoviricetes sp.]